MASFLRLAARQGCRLISSNLARQQKLIQPVSFISTSKKNKDAAVVNEKLQTPSIAEESIAEKEENWISYDYDLVDRNEDEWLNHAFWFVGWTVVIIGGTFYFMYYPDLNDKDWAQREAYLEVARRERLNLPLLDKNVVPEDKIELPSDEELGDTEIII